MNSNRKFQDIIFKFCGPKLSVDKVAPLEKSIGFTLPDDYRRFIAEINGGISIKRAFRCVLDPPPFTNGKVSFHSFGGEVPGVRFGPPTVEEKTFFQNAFRPRVVTSFYALKRTGTDCIGAYCREASILDTPDIRSFIPIAATSNGHLFISVNKDYFGFIYNGRFNTKAMPYWKPSDADIGSEEQPLNELEHCFVAKNFSELLLSLQFAKTLFVEGYQPSHTMKLIHVKTFDDNPRDENLPFDPPTKEKPKKNVSNSEKGKTSANDPMVSMQLKRQAQNGDDEAVWIGKITLGHWSDFTRQKSGQVDLRIVSEHGENIPESVFDALRYTVDNQTKLKAAILQAAVRQIREWKDGAVDAPEDLHGEMTLEGINVYVPPNNKPVQVGYILPCEWSSEHGFAVLTCGENVVDTGFYDILDCYCEGNQE